MGAASHHDACLALHFDTAPPVDHALQRIRRLGRAAAAALSADTLWIATAERGLRAIDLLHQTRQDHRAWARRSVQCLAVGPTGAVALGTLSGLERAASAGASISKDTVDQGVLAVTIAESGALALTTGGGVVHAEVDAGWLQYQAHGARAAAVARVGDRVLSGGTDARAVVADLDTDDARVLEGHVSAVGAVGLSACGRWAVTGAEDGSVKVWDAGSGSLQWSARLTGGGPVGAVAVVDTWVVACGRAGALRVFDRQTGAEQGVFAGHRRGVLALLPAGAGRVWSVGHDRTAALWHVAQAPAPVPLSGHADGVRAARIDGDRIWTASRDGTVRGFSWTSGACEVGPLRVTRGAAQVLLPRAQGGLFFGGTDGSVGILNESNHVSSRRKLHEGPVTCVRATLEGQLLTGGADGALRTWDAASLSPLSSRHDHTDRVRCMAVLPDGLGVVTGSYDGTWARVDPLQPARPVLARATVSARPIVGIAYTAERVVSGSLDGRVYSHTLTGDQDAVADADPDGVVGCETVGHGMVVTAGRGGRLELWSVGPGRLDRVDCLDMGVPLDGLTAAVVHGEVRVVVGDQRGGTHAVCVRTRARGPAGPRSGSRSDGAASAETPGAPTGATS